MIISALLSVGCQTTGNFSRVERDEYEFMTPTQKLLRASTTGDLAMVNEMLDAGVNVNTRGTTIEEFPLYTATNNNRVEIVELLIKRRANVDLTTTWGDSAINRACWLGYKKIADILARAGALRNDFYYFAGTNNVAGLNRLEARKPLDDGQLHGGIQFAAASGSENAFQWFLAKMHFAGDSERELFLSGIFDTVGRGGHINMLQWIERHYPATVKFESTALDSAIMWNRVPMAKYLISRLGMKPRVPNIFARPNSRPDPTFLFEVQHPEMARFLISQGANVNTRDEEGGTALMQIVSASWNPSETALVLLKNGADPNLQDKKGTTALKIARDDMTKAVLMKYGAKTVAGAR